MKKIMQWVASSFFRQAGRFLFYIIIGGLIYVLIQHNDIDFKWFNLFGIEQVKADSIKAVLVNWVDSNGNSLPNYYGQYKSFQYGQGYMGESFFAQGNAPVPSGSKGVYVSVSIGKVREGTEDLFCSNSSGNEQYCTTYTTKEHNNNISFDLYYNGGVARVNCYFLDNGAYTYKDNTVYQKAMMYCPIPTGATNIHKVDFFGIIDTTQNAFTTYTIGLEQTLLFDVSGTSDIIDNQNQNTNTTLEYFSDTNTTTDVNSANSFFTDTNSTSESALQDIVSTPLTLLNGLVNGTYTDLCATLNNKQICLPSGAIIWQRQHGGAGVHDRWFRGGSTQAFITFFNLVVGGFILYKCLISLFNSVHKMLDPTKTYVEVMKL